MVMVGLTVVITVTAAQARTKAEDPIKVTIIQRFQGGTSYFQDVAKGAKAEAAKVGVQLSTVFTNSSDEQLNAIDSAISGGAKGIILNIQDPSLGPAVVTKTKQAGVALLGSSDPFKDGSGKPVPVVTLDAKGAGKIVGTLAGTEYTKAKWNNPALKVKIAIIALPTLQTCNDRTDGALRGFMKKVPSFPKANVVKLTYDGTLIAGNNVMSAALNNHRDAKRWVVWSCNDEGMVGATKALANAGFAPKNVIGIGLGGNLSCNAWKSGKPTSYRGALVLDAKSAGASTVSVIRAFIVDGKPMPTITPQPMFGATPKTYKTQRKTLPC